MSMTEDYPGYPVRDAARLLGISVKAVRERLKRGTLSGRRVSTPHGDRWEVYLPEATRPSPERLPGGLPAEDYPGYPELERLQAEVEWLRSQVERVQEDARAAEERHARAESELRQLLEREQHNRLALEARLVRALPAPVLEEESPEETAVEPEPVEVLQAEEAHTEPETAEPSGELETPAPSRPWWRFWSL